MQIQSFPPLGNRQANRLVLGSMPGKASLLAQQYYAHPRNAFWYIVQELFGIPRELPYAQRARAVVKCGLAVWDVLAACTRSSSLDSDIVPESAVPNDLPGFLLSHPRITTIYFNGGAARALFERHVTPLLSARQQQIARMTLPSTSPTHARRTHADKLAIWKVIAR